MTQAKALEEGQGEALSLVGDDAPADAATLEVVKVFGDAGEQGGPDAQPFLIKREEALLKQWIGGVRRRDAKADSDHPAGAGGYVRTQNIQGHRHAAGFNQKGVQGSAQVGGGIRQSAVEVEQYRFRHCGGLEAGS